MQSIDVLRPILGRQWNSRWTAAVASLIADDDARWYEFGFRRPIDGHIPSIVEDLDVSPGLPGELVVSWEPASLADSYAVTKQVVGIDPGTVFVKRVSDTESILRDLPTGATVKVTIVAHNSTGDSLPVEAAAIVG
jgi:hypothetical protein